MITLKLKQKFWKLSKWKTSQDLEQLLLLPQRTTKPFQLHSIARCPQNISMHQFPILNLFWWQDEEEIEPDFDEEEEEEGEYEDNDGEEDTPENEANTGINFEVKIVKPSGVVLIAEGLASDELRINSIRFVPAGVDHENTDLYAGPDFSTLDDNVQAAFVDYFKDLHIDDDLSYFIISYSREKEQKEYFNWLKKLDEFTSK